MAITFLTSLTAEEFKDFLKESIRDIFHEGTITNLNSKPIPDILDAKQAATLLHIKLSTLYEKTSGKLIPHFKKGNKLYFQRTVLEEWINEGEIKTLEQAESKAITFTLNNHRIKKAA